MLFRSDQKQAAQQAATAAATQAVQSVVQKAQAGANTDKLKSAMQNAYNKLSKSKSFVSTLFQTTNYIDISFQSIRCSS